MDNDVVIQICKETGKNCYSRRIANELVNSQKHHKKKFVFFVSKILEKIDQMYLYRITFLYYQKKMYAL